MEITIIDDKKNRMEFELSGETHTFCNMLKEELKNDDHVKISAYNIDHPLIGKPHFVIETDTTTDPKKAMKDAIKRIKKKGEKFLDSVKKIK